MLVRLRLSRPKRPVYISDEWMNRKMDEWRVQMKQVKLAVIVAVLMVVFTGIAFADTQVGSGTLETPDQQVGTPEERPIGRVGSIYTPPTASSPDQEFPDASKP
ncbi:MAG: hypothetical protein U0946_01660, partial [Patescibacteria group bacterium]|nr:hypothetical protein [Patescibacteria group bacterium]